MKRTVVLEDHQVQYLLGLLDYNKHPKWSRKEIDRDLIYLLRTAEPHA